MTTIPTVTDEQLQQIRLRAVNDVTRAIAASGILLTHEQADGLGEEALGWLGGRLGLNVKETDRGMECTSPKHYSGEDARRAGIEIADEQPDDELATYSINCTDTDHPTPWMDTPGIVKMRPGNQDSGRCAWTVVTTQPEALETALDADETVLEYEAVES